MSCFFVDNVSDSNGGAIGNYSSSYSYVCCPEIRNCVFYGNEAQGGDGGAIYNHDNASPFVVSCTFAENTASSGRDGLSIYNCDDSIATISNSILWNESVSQAEVIKADDAMFVVSFSDVQGCGGSSNWDDDFGIDAGGNIDCAPDFMMDNIANYTVAGDDEILGTDDDGLVLVELCDAMDAADGYNASYYDIAGTARKDMDKADAGIGSCSYADMGAYENGYDICENANVLIMCFIDESKVGSYWGNETLFTTHLSEYNSLISYPGFVVKAGCYVPPEYPSGSSIFDVLPADPYDVPSNITMEMFHENSDRLKMEKDWFVSVFNTLRDGMTPDYIFLFVDCSGSLHVSDLQYHYDSNNDNNDILDRDDPYYSNEGFSGFVGWLKSTSPYSSATFINDNGFSQEGDEKWLKWVNEELVSEFINSN